jgi:hypothetical protein
MKMIPNILALAGLALALCCGQATFASTVTINSGSSDQTAYFMGQVNSLHDGDTLVIASGNHYISAFININFNNGTINAASSFLRRRTSTEARSSGQAMHRTTGICSNGHTTGRLGSRSMIVKIYQFPELATGSNFRWKERKQSGYRSIQSKRISSRKSWRSICSILVTGNPLAKEAPFRHAPNGDERTRRRFGERNAVGGPRVES